jgi:hypothetical protein
LIHHNTMQFLLLAEPRTQTIIIDTLKYTITETIDDQLLGEMQCWT